MKKRKGPPPDFQYRPADAQERKKGWRWVMGDDYAKSWSNFEVGYKVLSSLSDAISTKAQIAGRPYASISREGIVVAKDYAWDGSTFGREWKTGIRASLIHDGGYQIMRDYERDWDPGFRKDFRWDFDRLFLEAQRQDGMPWLVRQARYRAVRWWPRNKRVR